VSGETAGATRVFLPMTRGCGAAGTRLLRPLLAEGQIGARSGASRREMADDLS